MHGSIQIAPSHELGMAQAKGGGYLPSVPGDYVGVTGADGGRDEERTKALLRALNRVLASPNPYSGPPLHCAVPAGYTYLAQFAAHDLTLNAALQPSTLDGAPADFESAQNRRNTPLMLETLYGEQGLKCCPWFEGGVGHGSGESASDASRRFVLSGIGANLGQGLKIPVGHPARDIARTRAQADSDGRTPQARELCAWQGTGEWRGVPVLADPRNDDQPMLSQLTTLFQITHNLLIEEGRQRQLEGEALYQAARTSLIDSYRRILFDDFLPKILDKKVEESYRNRPRKYLDEAANGACVSREFAHAAYRMGHAMVRDSYKFGMPPQDVKPQGVEDALRQTSRSQGVRNIPLGEEWVINWSRFFELSGASSDANHPQSARPIAPRFISALVKKRNFAGPNLPGSARIANGLLSRDLFLSLYGGLRRVDTLCALAHKRLPALSAQLDPSHVRRCMNDWLERARLLRSPTLDPWLGELRNNPPPFIFFLAEAVAQFDGSRLGTLGSIIVADTFYRAREHFPLQVNNSLFSNSVPASMPALIKWVAPRLQDQDQHTTSGKPLPLFTSTEQL